MLVSDFRASLNLNWAYVWCVIQARRMSCVLVVLLRRRSERCEPERRLTL